MAGTVVLSTLNDSSGVLATQNGMTGIAKAWVNYNGVAQTITGSGAFNATSALKIPVGTTAQQPSPVTGQIRFNSTINQFEGYYASAWGQLGGGATGGGATGGSADQIFVLNDQTVTANYSIPATKNAMSAGPITIANSISVTVSTGANWVVV